MRWKEYRERILTTVDAESFYVDEFAQRKLQYTRRGNELKGQCPFNHLHAAGKDSNPSFTVNLSTGVYYCNACGSKGNIHTFYTVTRNTTKQEAWFAFGDALGLERPTDIDTRPGIDPALPAKYHRDLMQSTGTIRDILRDRRGLTDQTLVNFMLGWDGDRVTIPIYDEFHELVNIRRYKWNSYEDSAKMINYEDEMRNSYGENRIYGIEHLTDKSCQTIVWCEGEFDRIVAEQAGIPACTATAGANNFKNEWLKLLRSKQQVYICYDNDSAGREATDSLVANLRGYVKIFVVKWPENFADKGDISDFFVKEGGTKEEFLALFQQLDEADDVPLVPLAMSSDAKFVGRRVKIPVLVAGKEATPYVFPTALKISCDYGDPESRRCQYCSLAVKPTQELSINSSDPLLLKLFDCTEEEQRTQILKAIGASKQCGSASVVIQDMANIEALHLIPKADPTTEYNLRQEYVTRLGYCLGNSTPSNRRYTLVGYVQSHPKNQHITYVFDQAIPEKDMLEAFEITDDIKEKLSIFKCAAGQTVHSKFNEIHTDLERNVTYIWQRRNVAFAVDLIYHTALSFYFQEQFIKRGWGECLIIGDSGQAKTTLVERLMLHYKAGELVSGESSKRTGLVYSLQQLSGSSNWSLIWGKMPANDGGLLTIDELSGMPADELEKLSDVRSSGVAKTNGVIAAETTARARIIFISNPRNGRQLNAETYGVNAILRLFGKAEDVRRLDFAIALASGDIDPSIVNRSIIDIPAVEHKYTSDLCKLRVAWAWSRKADQILFEESAIHKILDEAVKMGRKYSSKIPLVESADQRLKIARLAISTAACVFSSDESGENIVVKVEHVDFVVDFLNSIYDTRAMGYDRFSTDTFMTSDSSDSNIIKLRTMFNAIPLVTLEIIELVKILYTLPYFSRNILEDSTGLDRDELKAALHFLISNSLVERVPATNEYRRTPLGTTFLEDLLMRPPTEQEIIDARKAKYSNSEI